MDIKKAMEERHSVRQYLKKEIPVEIIRSLQDKIDECNKEGGLHIQLVTGEEEAFQGFMAHYGKFDGVENYIALIGKKSGTLQEKAGYYGEQIVLLAQQLGLNTCWVASSFRKKKCRISIEAGEKMVCVISLGYGKTQGVPHKGKNMEDLYEAEGEVPTWFMEGVEAASLAPTAINQQKFMFSLCGDTAEVRKTGGFYSDVDLGIVKYHFEAASGRKIWK